MFLKNGTSSACAFFIARDVVTESVCALFVCVCVCVCVLDRELR